MNTTIEEIAGYMPERFVWQMLHEVSAELARLHGKGTAHGQVNPKHIHWDEMHFSLSANSGGDDAEAYKYEAPEAAHNKPCAASDVWSLAATAFYMHIGCHVLNGQGGQSQSLDTPMPFMRKELEELSSTLKQCLSFAPSKRPTAEQLRDLSELQLKNMAKRAKPRERKAGHRPTNPIATTNQFWPEEMTEA